MQQIKDIFSQCETALQVVINNYNDAIDQLTEHMGGEKSQIQKLRAITKSFTSLVSDGKELNCIFRVLLLECEKHSKNNKIIFNLQQEYDRCKNRTFMQIGYLNNALSQHLNNQNATDNYMLKSENMTKLNEMLVSTELLEDLNTTDMDLLQELEDTHVDSRKKMPASATNLKTSKSVSKSDLPDLDEVDDLFEDDEPEIDEEFDASEEIGEETDTIDIGEEIGEEITDETGDSIFSDNQIKEGGLNDNSDVVVSAGGATHVVGEKYKTYVRDNLLRLRNAEDREEQVQIMGHSSEDELENMVQSLESTYALDLIAEAGLSSIFVESLDNFEDRVKELYSLYKQNTKKTDAKVDSEYRQILKSIEKTRIDPLHWANILIINDNLRKMFESSIAGSQKDMVKQNIKNLKPFIVETSNQIKKLQSLKSVKSPEPWTREFVIDINKKGDPIADLIKIQKHWVKIMVDVEIYLGKSATYLDSVWILSSPSLADLKYRIYLFSKLKDQTYKKAIDTLIKKFNVKEYPNLKDLVEDI
jgi:hypothetical protein